MPQQHPTARTWGVPCSTLRTPCTLRAPIASRLLAPLITSPGPLSRTTFMALPLPCCTACDSVETVLAIVYCMAKQPTVLLCMCLPPPKLTQPFRCQSFDEHSANTRLACCTLLCASVYQQQ